MIAELFYPKELKQIIADLRAKDDLNEDALKNFDSYVYRTLKSFVFVIFLGGLFLFHPKAGWDAWVLVSVSFPLMLLGFEYLLSRYVKQYLRLYNFGKFTSGVCESYGVHRGCFGMTSIFSLDGTERRSHIKSVDVILKGKPYKKGDSVLIAYDPQSPDNNVPFIPSLADVFYLRKESPNDNN